MVIILLFHILQLTIRSTASNNNSIPNFVQETLSNYFGSYSLSNHLPLYNLNNEIIAHLLILQPHGYIVCDDFDIIESSFLLDFQLDLNDTLYYFGPLQIFIKTSDDTYLNLFSNNVYTKSDIEKISYIFNKNRLYSENEIEENAGIMPRAVVEKQLPYSTRTYNYNPDGRCGSIALAILLMYYDDHIDSNVVPSWISNADTTGKYFSDLLTPHLEGINSNYGSSTSDLISGARWYLSYRGISNTYSVNSVANATFSAVKSRIDANRPIIVDLDAHPTYNEHWVVGTGYYRQSTGSNSSRDLITINDGWGHSGIEINFKYVGDIVYLNK